MRRVREATIGEPALARSADGEPAFWLVPFESGGRACGFARVDLSGRVAQISAFGAGADDTASWPEADFFRRTPPGSLSDIRARHPGLPLAEPVLSYDGNSAKWAWRIAIGEPAKAIAYVAPGGWYEKPPGAPQDREG
jgi:hypothetical protein